MDSAFDTDMNAAAHWPAAVDIAVRIDYPSGPPEHSRLLLDDSRLPFDRSSAASAVRLTTWRSGAHPAEPELVRWTDLPGRTLDLRCLYVLAVNLFGTVDMPPRISGAPLWSTLTLDMALAADDDPQALHVVARSAAAPGRADLGWRLRRDAPLQTSVLVLDHLDADPMRALLRHSMALPLPLRPPEQHADPAPVERGRAAQWPANSAAERLAAGTALPASETVSSAGA